MWAAEAEQFLTHLAVNGRDRLPSKIKPNAHCCFFIKKCWQSSCLGSITWNRQAPKRLLVVLNRDEIQVILSRLTGTNWLIAGLLYGTGMRIMECMRLRVQDVDIKRCEI